MHIYIAFVREEFRHTTRIAAKAFRQQLTHFLNRERLRPIGWEWERDGVRIFWNNDTDSFATIIWRNGIGGREDRPLTRVQREVFEEVLRERIDPRDWNPRGR